MGGSRLSELVKKPQFKTFIEFSDQTGLVIKRKQKILQTNCTPIAFGILSVSKLILLRNYYNILLPALQRSGAETITCYSDTGRLCLKLPVLLKFEGVQVWGIQVWAVQV